MLLDQSRHETGQSYHDVLPVLAGEILVRRLDYKLKIMLASARQNE